MTALETLRREGWNVAVHNDYHQAGVRYTFWLFTHHAGVWALGEGLTDEEACLEALVQARERLAKPKPKKARRRR